jgi:predicted DNA-binding transcriptional regulator AlpA
MRSELDQEALFLALGAEDRAPLLTVKDAASLLRLSPSWLAKARMRGDGPAYVKFGRSVRYSRAALTKWAESRIRRSTSER